MANALQSVGAESIADTIEKEKISSLEATASVPIVEGCAREAASESLNCTSLLITTVAGGDICSAI